MLSPQKPLRILGIESSCDDTAAAIVDCAGVDQPGTIKASIVTGQTDLHSDFGGVVPEIAARAHAERLDICVEQALAESELPLQSIDAIAVTAGPGLIGGVLSGVLFAKGLAAGLGKPVIGVNHLAGHALTPRMTHAVRFPYLLLLVSGGHCQFIAVTGPTSFERLGGTIDDAPGEAFDKTARLLGLGYPGGPLIEAEAKNGNPDAYPFPRPLLDRDGCDMSFSGLKTALRRERDALIDQNGGITRPERADLCASFQNAVVDVLEAKTNAACQRFRQTYGTKSATFAVAGGVAANRAIRTALEHTASANGLDFVAPAIAYCTDNAAMIAWAGAEAIMADPSVLTQDFTGRPRWPLDQNAKPMLGFGRKGAKA